MADKLSNSKKSQKRSCVRDSFSVTQPKKPKNNNNEKSSSNNRTLRRRPKKDTSSDISLPVEETRSLRTRPIQNSVKANSSSSMRNLSKLENGIDVKTSVETLNKTIVHPYSTRQKETVKMENRLKALLQKNVNNKESEGLTNIDNPRKNKSGSLSKKTAPQNSARPKLSSQSLTNMNKSRKNKPGSLSKKRTHQKSSTLKLSTQNSNNNLNKIATRSASKKSIKAKIQPKKTVIPSKTVDELLPPVKTFFKNFISNRPPTVNHHRIIVNRKSDMKREKKSCNSYGTNEIKLITDSSMSLITNARQTAMGNSSEITSSSTPIKSFELLNHLGVSSKSDSVNKDNQHEITQSKEYKNKLATRELDTVNLNLKNTFIKENINIPQSSEGNSLFSDFHRRKNLISENDTLYVKVKTPEFDQDDINHDNLNYYIQSSKGNSSKLNNIIDGLTNNNECGKVVENLNNLAHEGEKSELQAVQSQFKNLLELNSIPENDAALNNCHKLMEVNGMNDTLDKNYDGEVNDLTNFTCQNENSSLNLLSSSDSKSINESFRDLVSLRKSVTKVCLANEKNDEIKFHEAVQQFDKEVKEPKSNSLNYKNDCEIDKSPNVCEKEVCNVEPIVNLSIQNNAIEKFGNDIYVDSTKNTNSLKNLTSSYDIPSVISGSNEDISAVLSCESSDFISYEHSSVPDDSQLIENFKINDINEKGNCDELNIIKPLAAIPLGKSDSVLKIETDLIENNLLTKKTPEKSVFENTANSAEFTSSESSNDTIFTEENLKSAEFIGCLMDVLYKYKESSITRRYKKFLEKEKRRLFPESVIRETKEKKETTIVDIKSEQENNPTMLILVPSSGANDESNIEIEGKLLLPKDMQHSLNNLNNNTVNNMQKKGFDEVITHEDVISELDNFLNVSEVIEPVLGDTSVISFLGKTKDHSCSFDRNNENLISESTILQDDESSDSDSWLNFKRRSFKKTINRFDDYSEEDIPCGLIKRSFSEVSHSLNINDKVISKNKKKFRLSNFIKRKVAKKIYSSSDKGVRSLNKFQCSSVDSLNSDQVSSDTNFLKACTSSDLQLPANKSMPDLTAFKILGESLKKISKIKPHIVGNNIKHSNVDDKVTGEIVTLINKRKYETDSLSLQNICGNNKKERNKSAKDTDNVHYKGLTDKSNKPKNIHSSDQKKTLEYSLETFSEAVPTKNTMHSKKTKKLKKEVSSEKNYSDSKETTRKNNIEEILTIHSVEEGHLTGKVEPVNQTEVHKEDTNEITKEFNSSDLDVTEELIFSEDDRTVDDISSMCDVSKEVADISENLISSRFSNPIKVSLSKSSEIANCERFSEHEENIVTISSSSVSKSSVESSIKECNDLLDSISYNQTDKSANSKAFEKAENILNQEFSNDEISTSRNVFVPHCSVVDEAPQEPHSSQDVHCIVNPKSERTVGNIKPQDKVLEFLEKYFETYCIDKILTNECHQGDCNYIHVIPNGFLHSFPKEEIESLIKTVVKHASTISISFLREVLLFLGQHTAEIPILSLSGRVLSKLFSRSSKPNIYYLREVSAIFFVALNACGLSRVEAMTSLVKYNTKFFATCKLESIACILEEWELHLPSLHPIWPIIKPLVHRNGFSLSEKILIKFISEVMDSNDLDSVEFCAKQLLLVPEIELSKFNKDYLENFFKKLVKVGLRTLAKKMSVKMFHCMKFIKEESEMGFTLRKVKSLPSILEEDACRFNDIELLCQNAIQIAVKCGNYRELVKAIDKYSGKNMKQLVIKSVFDCFNEEEPLMMTELLIKEFTNHPEYYKYTTFCSSLICSFVIYFSNNCLWEVAYGFMCLFEKFELERYKLQAVIGYVSPLRIALVYSEVFFQNGCFKDSVKTICGPYFLSKFKNSEFNEYENDDDSYITQVLLKGYLSEYLNLKKTDYAAAIFKLILDINYNNTPTIDLMEYFEVLANQLFNNNSNDNRALDFYIALNKQREIPLFGLTIRVLVILAYRHKSWFTLTQLFKKALACGCYPWLEAEEYTIILLKSFTKEEMNCYFSEWFLNFKKRLQQGSRFTHKYVSNDENQKVLVKSTISIRFKEENLADYLEHKHLNIPLILQEVDEDIKSSIARLKSVLKTFQLKVTHTENTSIVIDSTSFMNFLKKI